MQTSALSFQQVLTVASTSSDRKASFLQVLADYLNLQESDARAQVLSILLSKMSKIESDIESLPVDDGMKNHLKKQLAPFNAISNLSQVHMSIESAKSHFLKADLLLGLMNIHLALTGHVVRENVERVEAENLAQKFRNVAEEIQGEDLPESLKHSLLKRTLKMASILDHYYAFGPEDLQSELAALSVAGLVILTTVDASLSKVVSITENASKLVEFVDEMED